MSFDISKTCSDYLRSIVLADIGAKLQASHARELVAAYFGYKSHAALLAENLYPLAGLGGAAVLVPDVAQIEKRRSNLEGLPVGLYRSYALASKLSEFLVKESHFKGKVWLYDNLESYVTDVLLHDEDSRMMDLLSGVMAETNAYFDEEPGHYEVVETIASEDGITLEIAGQYFGTSDPERPFCGDQIDVSGTVELARVAGRMAFAEPDIAMTGEVNQDWVDPELRFGVSES